MESDGSGKSCQQIDVDLKKAWLCKCQLESELVGKSNDINKMTVILQGLLV